MMYRIQKGWLIGGTVLAIILCIAGISSAVYSNYQELDSEKKALLFMGIFFLALGTLTLGLLFRTSILLENAYITETSLFYSRTAAFTDIQGFRRGEKGRVSLIMNNGGKKINISAYLENRERLLSFITAKFTDLDTLDFRREEKELLQNDEFGSDSIKRSTNLKTASKLCTVASIGAIILAVWEIIAPRPPQWLMWVLLALPWVAAYAIWAYNGLIRLDKKKSSPHPSMIVPLLLPVFAAILGVIRDDRIYDFPSQAVLLLAAITAAMIVCFYRTCAKAITAEKRKGLTMTCIVVMAGLYSFAGMMFANCQYDHSTPKVYTAIVAGKDISTGKTTTYYLILSPWGRFTEGSRESVHQELYRSVQMDDSVHINCYQGRWNIPWFHIVND
jgi:hypothetical protein